MHAGFFPLRRHMPMNLQDDKSGDAMGEGVAANIARICDIWEDCLERFGGDGGYLFGAFTGADIMFAPVVTRFHAYGVDLPAPCQTYSDAVRARPDMAEWTTGAIAED